MASICKEKGIPPFWRKRWKTAYPPANRRPPQGGASTPEHEPPQTGCNGPVWGGFCMQGVSCEISRTGLKKAEKGVYLHLKLANRANFT